MQYLVNLILKDEIKIKAKFQIKKKKLRKH